MDGQMLSHIMNSNMLNMMTMKENVSIYHILMTLFIMNITPYVPTIKQIMLKYIEHKVKETVPIFYSGKGNHRLYTIYSKRK